MYQCQMAKQTMGTPYHNHPYRMDNKVYRILFPQAPLVRTQNHTKYDFGQCPQGTNAVVAVISYTGYDMEDAMILNKGAYERGFGHGCVYKSYIRELNDQSAGNASAKSRFKMFNSKKGGELQQQAGVDLAESGLDADGLPPIGKKLEQGQPEMCVFDKNLQKAKFTKFKDNESARIENIRLMSDDKNTSHNVKLGYTIRYPRNPIIGDKFSSRHG
mmetsp:Transcript_31722/g.48611  ORF Transcript_31722/g.48611 Transcript_31722/m.48611 type:complete len:216 (+) Transcript_31722:2266-2913(+)